MNRLYIITYDLKFAWLRNYNPLFNLLRTFPYWMHEMDNTWFVVSNLTPLEIYNACTPYIFTDCRIVIARFRGEYFGQLSQQGWDWLESHRELF